METFVNEDIRIFPGPDRLAEPGARIFADAARRSIASRGKFSAALSGGSTPRILFRILRSKYCDKIRWGQVHLFWSDERAVPKEHEQSNFRLANEELISGISIPEINIHRVCGELGPIEAASEYEKELHRYFGPAALPIFDLVFLGLGQDGHIASLFPGSDALKENSLFAVPSYSESAGNWRITLTLPVINNASEIIFLVSGRSKAGIVREVIGSGNRGLYPACLVKPANGRTTWLLDSEAAELLNSK